MSTIRSMARQRARAAGIRIGSKRGSKLKTVEVITVENPVHKRKGKWYFWDETWAFEEGPFSSEQKANRELIKYNNNLVKEVEEREREKFITVETSIVLPGDMRTVSTSNINKQIEEEDKNK
jgi:hypothetical protein